MKDGKLGVALVGLGKYSTGQLAPALRQTKKCYLSAIVTGSDEKAEKWARKYDIPDKNIFDYSNFQSIASNEDVDIVYVVLPNALHAEFCIKAARAGKHVICEKPMAVSVQECDSIIEACNSAKRRLSIGYRLHFEPHHLEMMRLGRQREFGEVRRIVAEHGMSSVEGWRIQNSLAGGGPLMDVGIYCVQGARYTLGMEPLTVIAQGHKKTKPEKFKDVEESMSWQMEFANGIVAECKTSYVEEQNLLRAEAERGWFELKPAYQYEGIKGKTSRGIMNIKNVEQQARQMDDFAEAIMDGRPSPVPGEMGRQDVKIMQAIYESMRTGKQVAIDHN